MLASPPQVRSLRLWASGHRIENCSGRRGSRRDPCRYILTYLLTYRPLALCRVQQAQCASALVRSTTVHTHATCMVGLITTIRAIVGRQCRVRYLFPQITLERVEPLSLLSQIALGRRYGGRWAAGPPLAASLLH